MQTWILTRRAFIRLAAALGLVSAAGCFAPLPNPGGGVIVFKRSGRGLRISNAAKKHNANHLYATAAVAASDPPHRGDSSRVVKVVISETLAAQLFGSGRMIVDLRHVL